MFQEPVKLNFIELPSLTSIQMLKAMAVQALMNTAYRKPPMNL